MSIVEIIWRVSVSFLVLSLFWILYDFFEFEKRDGAGFWSPNPKFLAFMCFSMVLLLASEIYMGKNSGMALLGHIVGIIAFFALFVAFIKKGLNEEQDKEQDVIAERACEEEKEEEQFRGKEHAHQDRNMNPTCKDEVIAMLDAIHEDLTTYKGCKEQEIVDAANKLLAYINKYDEPLWATPDFLLLVDAINGLLRVGTEYIPSKELQEKYIKTLCSLAQDVMAERACKEAEHK